MSRSKEAKVALYREMYGGAPACGASALVVPPVNFQRGVPPTGAHQITAGKAFLRHDFAEVEVRVAASVFELSDEERELSKKLGTLLRERMDFAIKKRLGMRPSAIDIE